MLSGSKGETDGNDLLQQDHRHVPLEKKARGTDRKGQILQERMAHDDRWAWPAEKDEMFPGISTHTSLNQVPRGTLEWTCDVLHSLVI